MQDIVGHRLLPMRRRGRQEVFRGLISLNKLPVDVLLEAHKRHHGLRLRQAICVLLVVPPLLHDLLLERFVPLLLQDLLLHEEPLRNYRGVEGLGAYLSLRPHQRALGSLLPEPDASRSALSSDLVLFLLEFLDKLHPLEVLLREQGAIGDGDEGRLGLGVSVVINFFIAINVFILLNCDL